MIRLRVEKSDRKLISQKQVTRASRLAINDVTRKAHKELGGTVPKAHGTSITGYRRVRSKKTLAKARKRRLRGIVWQGTKDIQATYAGKARKVKGGVKAGRFFFPGAYIMRFKSGHVGIFKRVNGVVTEEMIELDRAKQMVNEVGRKALRDLPKAFRTQYKKLVKK